MILVTGATGNVGREIVKKLNDDGYQVRILTRNPAKVSFPANIEVAVGDLTDSENLKATLKGIEKVFLIRVPGSDNFPRIAKASGVKTIVFLSSGAIESKAENFIGQIHLHTEELIRKSDVKWTFLRPGAFMSNTLQWARSIKTENIVRAPFGDVGTAPIDPRDVALVAAKVLVSSDHNGKIYTLTGPEVLTPTEQVKILGAVLEKEIRFENVPDTAAEMNMKKFAPPEIVDALFTLMKDQRNHPAVVSNTVKHVTGNPAHTFKDWATDNANLF